MTFIRHNLRNALLSTGIYYLDAVAYKRRDHYPPNDEGTSYLYSLCFCHMMNNLMTALCRNNFYEVLSTAFKLCYGSHAFAYLLLKYLKFKAEVTLQLIK